MSSEGIHLSVGTPDLLSFPGMESENQQIGSDGNFKGTKVSALKDSVQKKVLGSDYDGYQEKRSKQKSITARRIRVLEELSPSDIARNLDSAKYSYKGPEVSTQARNSNPVQLEGVEDTLTQALQKVSGLVDQLQDDAAPIARKGKKSFQVVTEKGLKKRAQADNTILLTNTIRSAECPHTLSHIHGVVETAVKNGDISKKQGKQLQGELEAQAQKQLNAFYESVTDLKSDASETEWQRQEILEKMNDLRVLTTTVKTINRDLLRSDSLGRDAPTRKVIRDTAMMLHREAAARLEPSASLLETQERFESSMESADVYLKPLLDLTSSRPGTYLKQAKDAAVPAHAEMKKVLNQIPKDREYLKTLNDEKIPGQQSAITVQHGNIETLKESVTKKQKAYEAVKTKGRFSTARTQAKKELDTATKQLEAKQLELKVMEAELSKMQKVAKFRAQALAGLEAKYSDTQQFTTFHTGEGTEARKALRDTFKGANGSESISGAELRLLKEDSFKAVARGKVSEADVKQLVDYVLERMSDETEDTKSHWEFQPVLDAFNTACSAMESGDSVKDAIEKANGYLHGYSES